MMGRSRRTAAGPEREVRYVQRVGRRLFARLTCGHFVAWRRDETSAVRTCPWCRRVGLPADRRQRNEGLTVADVVGQ